MTCTTTHYMCDCMREKLAAAEARVAELEQQMTRMVPHKERDRILAAVERGYQAKVRGLEAELAAKDALIHEKNTALAAIYNRLPPVGDFTEPQIVSGMLYDIRELALPALAASPAPKLEGAYIGVDRGTGDKTVMFEVYDPKRRELELAALEKVLWLWRSGYDGPFVGEEVAPLFGALAALDAHREGKE